MIKVKDGYAKLIGVSALGTANQVLLSNGGDIGKAVSSTANTLVERNSSGLIESSVATNTSPFKITSTTVNTNLNADLLDNFHATGLFQSLTSAKDKNLYIKIGGTEKNIALYATYDSAGNTIINKYVTLDTNLSISGVKTFTSLQKFTVADSAPFTVASTTVVSNLNADLLDGTHKTGLLTGLSNVNTTDNPNSISLTVGGTTKYLAINYAKESGKVSNKLILKVKTGTTEGTDLYTYDGSSAKTLDIKQGNGITLTAAANALTITNAGVRSISTGDNNGTIKVNTNGTSTNVAVKGLGSAAYTNSTDYAVRKTLNNENLNDVVTPGFYNAGGGNTVTNKPDGVAHFGLEVIHGASGSYYVQILYKNSMSDQVYRRHCQDGTWSSWTLDKLTDNDTKNTAGSTNSASKLYLIGATSQAANPLTYSNSAVFATAGILNATAFVSGSGTSDFTAGTVKLDVLNIPKTSGGTEYGPGSNGLVLKSNGTTVYWASDNNTNYYRPISVNGTSILGNNNTALNLVAGSNITITPEKSGDAYTGKVSISSSYVNTTYTLSGTYGTSNKTYVITLTPSSGTATNATIPTMVGATSSAAGKEGLVPLPASGDRGKFLRGDGVWTTISIPNVSITNSGSGNAIASLSASGHTITATKGNFLPITAISASTDLTTLTANALYYIDTDGNAATLTNSPWSNSFTMLQLQGYSSGDDVRRYRLAINGYGAAKLFNDRDTGGSGGSWVDVLTSINSSVSGDGGSSWGSSITVKINNTTATLTIPSNPNTDSKVSLSETTTSSYRPVILGYTFSSTAGSGMTTSTTNVVYASNKFYALPSTGNLYATLFVGNLLGNASTASKLATARTISLTGSVTGSGSFDGSGNLSIATTTNHNHGMGLTTITKSIKVTTSWQNTGITGANIGTGAFVVTIESISDYNNGGVQYSEHYVGLMASYASTTNSTVADEIPLHRAGHAPNFGILYLRTLRLSSSGYVQLQIAGNYNMVNAQNITFKFRRII